MIAPKIILLPGLDGDGFYYAPLQDLLKSEYDCSIVRYPVTPLSFEELSQWICGNLDPQASYIIVAGSFGGPVGIHVAHALGERARALLLCSTFCKAPLPSPVITLVESMLPWLLRHPDMSAHLINGFMYNNCDLIRSRQVHQVLLGTPQQTILNRMRLVSRLDITGIINELSLPVLVIKAKHDRLVWFDTFNNRWPVKYADGPHEFISTQPEVIAQAISEFISKAV